MPNKHFYFALGALHGAAVAAAIHRRAPRWRLHFPFVIGAFGALALVPDALLALHVLPKPVIRAPLFNVFYGYAWFESVEDLWPRFDWAMNTLGSLILYVLSLAVLAIYARLAARAIGAAPRA